MLSITEFLKTENKFYKVVYLFKHFPSHQNAKELAEITTKINELLIFDSISLENEIINNLTNQNITLQTRKSYYNKYVYEFLLSLTSYLMEGRIIDKRSNEITVRLDTDSQEFYELKSVSENALNNNQKREYERFIKKLFDLMAEINHIMDRVELVVGDEFENSLSKKKNAKFNSNQRYYLLESIGLMKCDLLKGSSISQQSKYNLIANILDIDVRTAKGFLNGEEKYYPNEKGKEIVKTYLKDLK